MPILNRRRLFGLLPALPLAAAAVPMASAPAAPLKPFVLGRVLNVELAPVDRRDFIYAVNDGPVEEITAIRDGGEPLRFLRDCPDFETLRDTSLGLPPSVYTTCLAEGLIQVGWPPRCRYTADLIVRLGIPFDGKA